MNCGVASFRCYPFYNSSASQLLPFHGRYDIALEGLTYLCLPYSVDSLISVCHTTFLLHLLGDFYEITKDTR
jgi:hypothetical protein